MKGGLDDEAWNAMGIKDHHVVVPADRARCNECGQKIVPGSLRFDYRYKVNNSLSDQKRIHSTCVDRLPASTRVRDRAQLKRWLKLPHVSPIVSVSIEASLALLR